MNINAEKISLIRWISMLDDPIVIRQIKHYKNKNNNGKEFKRKFGCGKGLFTYISDDFDEPIIISPEFSLVNKLE